MKTVKVQTNGIQLLLLAEAIVKGFDEDPGHSDLDNEQPIVVRMQLGDYRRAKRLLYELEHPNAS